MRPFPYVLAAGFTLTACGSLDPNTSSAPALSTLKGNLSNPSSLPTGDSVRVAVVWRSSTFGQFNVAQDLPVQPVFPSSFQISLDTPPPVEAMNSAAPIPPPPQTGPTGGTAPGAGPPPPSVDAGGGSADGGGPTGGMPIRRLDPTGGSSGLQYALGTVVAYDDQNGNGKLDLVPQGATAYVDRIVASNQWTAIVYFQGDMTEPDAQILGYLGLKDQSGHLPSAGYNLLDVPRCDVSVPVSRSPGSSCTAPPPVVDAGTCQKMQWLPMSTPYTLTVATTPEVAMLMCQDTSAPGPSETTTGTAGPYNPANQPATYPDPCDPNVSCSADGSQYMYTTCTTVAQGICEGTYLSCTAAGYARPTPVPAGWPCTH